MVIIMMTPGLLLFFDFRRMIKYLLPILNITCIVQPHDVQVVLLFSGSIFWFYRYFSPS